MIRRSPIVPAIVLALALSACSAGSEGLDGSATDAAADAGAGDAADSGEADAVSPDAEPPATHWAYAGGGMGVDIANDVAALDDGSAAICGAFAGLSRFRGADDRMVDVLPVLPSPMERSDAFVARYDATGALLWVRRAGGRGGPSGDRDVAVACAAAPNDGVFVTGEVEGMLSSFDSRLQPRTVSGRGEADVFVALYDVDGALVWLSLAGGQGVDQASSIAATPGGGLVVAGRYQGTAIFGAGEPAETTLTSTAGFDAFVARYANDGKLSWARSIGGPSDDLAVAASSPAGDVWVATSSNAELILSRYTDTGSVAWTSPIGEGTLRRIVTTAGGDPILIASIDGAQSRGDRDVLIARFTRSGALAWMRQVGGTGADDAFGAAVTSDGAIYVAGTLAASEVVFDDGAGGTRVTIDAASTFFVAAWDEDGALLDVEHGLGDHAEARGVAVNSSSVFAAGAFGGTVEINGVALTANGERDAFIARRPF